MNQLPYNPFFIDHKLVFIPVFASKFMYQDLPGFFVIKELFQLNRNNNHEKN